MPVSVLCQRIFMLLFSRDQKRVGFKVCSSQENFRCIDVSYVPACEARWPRRRQFYMISMVEDIISDVKT